MNQVDHLHPQRQKLELNSGNEKFDRRHYILHFLHTASCSVLLGICREFQFYPVWVANQQVALLLKIDLKERYVFMVAHTGLH